MYFDSTRQPLGVEHVLASTALPPEQRADAAVQAMAAWGCTTTMSIVHMVYRSVAAETHSKDYAFSRAAVRDHWAAGLRDARKAFAEQRWLHRAPGELGVDLQEIVSHAYALAHRGRSTGTAAESTVNSGSRAGADGS